MAVKARDATTLLRVDDGVDVASVTRYYQLAASTASVPAKPTTNPPASAWSSKEPGYDGTTASTLYFTDLTVLSDGAFSYSDVSKSSAYEAAKQAYNKAANAQATADGSLAEVKVEYAVGSSATSHADIADGSWSTATPAWTSGKYVWQRTGTKANDETSYTYTYACIQGAQGERGFSILKVTTAPSAYTTKVGSFTPSYRIALSTVKSQSGATEVKAGDVLQYSYYQYKVGYVDATYAYTAARTSIRGDTGAAGSSVTKVAVTYGLSASNASDGYSSVTSWTSDVPAWTSGKYIWQRTVTTIGTTAQAPVYSLYGAFNSLAADVEGNASRITQTAEAVGVTFSGSGAVSTLIRETAEGVEVGKSADGETYSGAHVLLSGDSLTFLDKDGNTLAVYEAGAISLGKNSKSAIIDLCDGSGTLSQYESGGINLRGKYSVIDSLSTVGVETYGQGMALAGSKGVEGDASQPFGGEVYLLAQGVKPGDTRPSMAEIKMRAYYGESSVVDILSDLLRINGGDIYGEHVLYDNPSAPAGSVKLSSSCIVYKRLRIVVVNNDGAQQTLWCENPAVGSMFTATMTTARDSEWFMKSKTFRIYSAYKIDTHLDNNNTYWESEVVNGSGARRNYINISKVIGYK